MNTPNERVAHYKEKARQARIAVLGMVHKAQTSHIASNFSVLDLATVLHENLEKGDEVLWSKGWAAASAYYFLAKQGKIPQEDLEKFPNPPYLGLAETFVPGVWVSRGSMGQGLAVAAGMAYGKKLAEEKGIIYCILSDGEMQEGSTWEAILQAGHDQLNNLVVLVDYNKWCAMGRTNEILNLEPFEDKWKAFNWHAHRIDGHDHKKIEEMLLHECENGICRQQPTVIICDTIKVKGVSFFEDHLLYHYKNVTKEEYEKAMAELI